MNPDPDSLAIAKIGGRQPPGVKPIGFILSTLL